MVLTGAAGGIGAPTAKALAAAGARLLLVGRDGARLEALAGPLGAAWLAADLTTPEGIEAVRRAALEQDANVLVNNAGIASFGRLESLDPAHLVSVIETNLVAPMLLTRALLPGLQRQREAAVIHVGSVLGRLGLPGFSVYSAAKFGLRGFSEALRRELADTSVKVQYLGPRVTATGFNSAEVEAYNRATRTAADRPEAVAQALVALLESGRAERFLGFPEKFAVRLNGAAPAALDGAFERHRRALAPS
ncbi:MAG TPA: SDR family oxidoreductase [Methylibium sp.]|nr:SDR family oxidoreductase [Methylibium sp.]